MKQLIPIIINLAIATLTAVFGILALSKTKKIGFVFFVLASLFLYVNMVFLVLKQLNIFVLEEIKAYDFPIYQYTLNLAPMLFLSVGFVIMMLSVKDK